MVYEQSNKKQLPADYIKLLGDFYFLRQNNAPSYTPPVEQPTKDLPFGPEMVYIKGGTFDMGSTEGEEDEKPVHTVTVSGFSMAKYETTVREFAQFVAETNYKTDAEKHNSSRMWSPMTNKVGDSIGINWQYGADCVKLMSGMYNHPVVHVSHNDAVAYCKWLTKKTGKTYRLPTEAEWEYAKGNGSKHTKYSWGDGEPTGLVGNVADETFQQKFTNFDWKRFKAYTDGYSYTAPVGSFKSNINGLHDMTGNVVEWCNDWYDKTYYTSCPSINPMGANSGTDRVLRGGGWNNDMEYCRVSSRDRGNPSYRSNHVGFRVVSL